MSYPSDAITQKVTLYSKRIYLSGIITSLIAGMIGGAVAFMGLKLRVMEIIAILLFGIAALLLIISWIAPGIFVILRVPWLARAWLRGIHPILISDKPWEQLSRGEKFAVYFYAIVFLAFTLAIIVLILKSI